MCGRYAQIGKSRRKALTLTEEIQREIEFRAAMRPETWNLAPSTASLVVRERVPGHLAGDWLSWGLEAASPVKPINARLESVASKVTFRDSWQARRCLVPVDGWYEWRTENGRKQPYYFQRRDGDALWFAGLWTGETFCLLTTRADGDLATIHDRRPLTVGDRNASAWLNAAPASPEAAIGQAVSPDEISFHRVSPRVGSPRHDDEALTQPVAKEIEDLLL